MRKLTEEVGYLSRAHKRRRRRRLGRRAYVRSVHVLPSLATLGNAVCGFAAMYVAALGSFDVERLGGDPVTQFLASHSALAACYLILLAMIFDALDGRLARFARHTTDFGGQLDSLADVVSFGAAPAFIALQVFKAEGPHTVLPLSRLIWAIGAIYFSCAAVRLARFNVSNEHGEQHHFSFLGLPSPGAAGAVIGLIMMQQDLHLTGYGWTAVLAKVCIGLLPIVVLGSGLLMVSHIRYPHFVNRHLRGRRSIARLMIVVALLLALVVAHRYTLGIGMIGYAAWGAILFAMSRLKHRTATAPTV